MNMEEIRICAGESLSDAVEKLLKAKEEGRHVYCTFNGYTLDSDTVTLDSAYIEILGCTKKEHEERMAREIEESKKRREIAEQKAIKKIPKQINRGKKLMYSFRHDEWKELVEADATGMYTGLLTEDMLTIMEAIEDEKPVEDIVKIFDEQGHSGWSASIARNAVMRFSKNGYPFYKATHYGEWTIDECNAILEIMAENEEANEKTQLRLAMGAANSKQEVINKQKRLIRQLENNSNR